MFLFNRLLNTASEHPPKQTKRLLLSQHTCSRIVEADRVLQSRSQKWGAQAPRANKMIPALGEPEKSNTWSYICKP